MFISIIGLVIPLFFVFVLGSGLHSKLNQSENRRRLTCGRAEAVANDDSATEPDKETALKECSQASRDHDAARSAYLAGSCRRCLDFARQLRLESEFIEAGNRIHDMRLSGINLDPSLSAPSITPNLHD